MISVRIATAADVAIVSELRVALLSELPGSMPTTPQKPNNEDSFLKAIQTKLLHGTTDCQLNGMQVKELNIWVLEFDSRIVSAGALITTSMPSKSADSTEGYIFNMYTRPSYRKMGCGKAMLDEIVNYARSKSIGRLWLKASKDGLPLYQCAGFKVFGPHATGNTPMELHL